jgi:HK97 family phage prohead protease
MNPPRLCYRAVEFRAAENSDGRTLEGYAAVFDSPTRIDSWEGTFDEVLSRGAFLRSIDARTPVLQFDHGRDAATGSVPIGAIEELREDDHGLFVRARLHDNARVEPIRQAIESGAIDGMSFRFRVAPNGDTLQERQGDVPLRTIREAELFELGPVVFPAYAATSVGVRAVLGGIDPEERQALIRELAAELRIATDLSSPADPGTEDGTPDPAEAGTSGHANTRFRLKTYLAG